MAEEKKVEEVKVEDVDLGFRLRLAGCRCVYVPEAVVLHEGSAVTGRQSNFSVYHGHRNLEWTFVKNMPQPALWFFLFPHLMLTCLTMIWYCFRGQGKTILRAKYDALKGLYEVLRKRQRVQNCRVASTWSLVKLMSWGWWRRGYDRK